MSDYTITELEKTIIELPVDEQRRLIDRVAERLRRNAEDNSDFESQLAEMAKDENIQAELRKIERDFAIAEFDGLAE